VNSAHGDAALRVTISLYDENGDLTQSQTWRRHVRPLEVEGLDWQALAAVQDLVKMMGDACSAPVQVEGVDQPLF